MNILRSSTFSLTLAVVVFSLGYATITSTVFAHHKPGHNQGGGGGSDCQIEFSAVFRDASGDVIRSDGKGVYPTPGTRDKTLIAGGGGGFRFDTNGSSQKIEGAGGTRDLNLEQIPVELPPDFLSGVDFRFHLNVPRLHLCLLDHDEMDADGKPVPKTGEIPMILLFADKFGEEFKLLYDCIDHGGDPFPSGASNAPVSVTRTIGDFGTWEAGDEWMIEGTQACLISANNYATATDDLLVNDFAADFQMTITAQ